ncbi:unnamed protein product [Caenorhabditis angaria]|uniref:Uncharacterized protein n=1 Tax=Caenorhabditis angaria TaxID=860376 RepID=A0A9P1N7G1_9PELO|nr:unnamed protein product [Caenorhabditis angaria]
MSSLAPSRSEPNLSLKKRFGKVVTQQKRDSSQQRKPATNSSTKEQNSDESDKEESKNFFKTDLAAKLKHYDPNCLLAQNEVISVSGFERALFTSGKNVLILENGQIRVIEMGLESPKVLILPILGRATAITVSNDFSIFAVAVEEENNSKIVVYTPACGLEEESYAFGTQYLPVELCISQGAEIIACLAILEERIHLQTFDVKDGINNCTGNIMTEKTSKNWEISFCPADEGVLCAYGGGVAYLLRASGGYIENFSTIQLPDATCHDWSNDVNIMFGTKSGYLNVYRETILLETIDIKKFSEEVLTNLGDFQISCLRNTPRKFACLLSSGIVCVFDSASESGPVWDSCRVIIMSDFNIKKYHCLSFDFADEYLLYDDGRTLMSIPIRFLTKINSINGDIVTVRHCHKIIGIRSTDAITVTLDESGFFIVISKLTNRVLCTSKIDGAFAFTIPKHLNKIVIVTKNWVEKVTITLDGLISTETILEKNIVMAVDSYDMSMMAVLDQVGLIVFRTDTHRIVISETITVKKDIKQMTFSKDNGYLLFLTNNDHVYCTDLSTGKTLWNVDYKLHFFQSMIFSGSTLLLLNQKFIVTRIKHGKDLSNVNMHASDIGFSITSEIIEGNDNFVFISSNGGELLCSASSALDEPIVVKSVIRGLRITSLRTFDDELMIGYDNGSVGRLKLVEKIEKEIDNPLDLILCSFDGIVNLKSLLRDIDSERNMIRESSEKFVKLYTKNKEEELAQIKNKFDEIIKNYAEKVRKIESEFHQSEEIKKLTIHNLEAVYNEENLAQKTKYEKMIEDQIRKSLRQMDEKNEEIKGLHREFKQKSEDTIENFHVTEGTLKKQISKLILELGNAKKTISELEILNLQSKEDFKKLQDSHEDRIQKLKSNHREDTGLLEEEIWNLKATCVQLNEQRDRISDESSKYSSALKISKQQIEHLRDSNVKQEEAIKKLQDCITELRSKEVQIKKNHAKVQEKLNVIEKQNHEVTSQNHRWKRRMQDLESRIEQLAGCVYDARKLEHSVLSLLAMSQNVDMDERYRRPI